jgi:hypothetical protein
MRMRTTKWSGILVGIIGLAVTGIGYQNYLDSERLVREGKVTTAQVVNHDVHKRRHKTDKYYLTLEYQTENLGKQRKTLQVDCATFTSGKNDRQLKICYLPADPTICQLGDRARIETFGLLAGVFLIVVGGLVAAGYWKVEGRARVVLKGNLGMGQGKPAWMANEWRVRRLR